MEIALLLLLALAPVVAIALFVYLKDKYDKEPLWLLLLSFGLGILSVVPALGFGYILELIPLPETSQLFSVAFLAFVVVALSEESGKFIMARFVPYRSKHFNEPFDGIIYAVMVSLGFAAIENVLYVFNPPEGFSSVSVGVLRMFTAVPAHACFGIVMGYYMGLAKFDRENRTRLMLKGLAMAILLHGAYDYFLMLDNYPALGVLALITLALGIRLSLRAIKEHGEASPFKPSDDEPKSIEE